MKVEILIYFILAIASTIPLNEGYKEGDRYVYMPDDEGFLHHVDLQQEPNDVKVEANKILFYVFTRSNPTNGQQIILNNIQSLFASNLDLRKNVKVVAHGWLGHLNAPVNEVITSANLRNADVNVLVVDWSEYARLPNYMDAARRAPDVGRVVSQFIEFLIRNGAPVGNFHLVGFSLGAHVLANAARHTGMGRIPRLTGLDPAGPTYGPDNDNGIRASDAVYTEIIHTNGDYVGNGQLMGDADFFPNGGRLQPGCGINVACSHGRSFEYYAESIDNNDFMGQRCNSVNDAVKEQCTGPSSFPMGGAWNRKSASGIFHVPTNSKSPFAKK